MSAVVELREEARTASPFRLPRWTGADGMLRRRGGVLIRLLHLGETPVLVRAAQTAPDTVVLAARSPTREAAAHGIARMRFALGVDEDLRPFLVRFAGDALIGRSLARRPWLRVARRPDPFEALAWAICEQLIEYERAAAIERRVLAALGRRWPAEEGIGGGLCDLPLPRVLARTAPARLQSFDLGGSRAITLVRVAREVASGRVDLHASEHEHGWRRLRAIPGVGSWTVEMLALYGQGRHDQVPAADVGLLKLVGRRLSGGDPRARAREDEVREFFAPYGQWAGLAATHLCAV
jgi:3-methyladenine DNA glycosylase/8-oxoguanine DNA glycosylase